MNSLKYCEVCGSQAVGVIKGMCCNCRRAISYAKRRDNKPHTTETGFGVIDTSVADMLNKEEEE